MKLSWHILARVAIVVLGSLWASGVHAQVPDVNMSIKPDVPLISVAEAYLLDSINGERAALGMPAVKLDRGLESAAQKHAGAMAMVKTLSHQLTGEPDLLARGAAAGAQFSRITENVAVGPSIITMHEALMRSQHHRENILDDQVTAVGISVVQHDGTLWAVEDFSRKVDALSLDEQESRVSELLKKMQLAAAPTPDARATCSLTQGYVGQRPAYTMRYTTGDLTQLPEQLRSRVQTAPVHSAGVGACSGSQSGQGFSSYNIAVVLYR